MNAQRGRNFKLFVASLIKILPHVVMLDRSNYARWLPVAIHDLLRLFIYWYVTPNYTKNCCLIMRHLVPLVSSVGHRQQSFGTRVLQAGRMKTSDQFRLIIDCPDWFHTGNMKTELIVPADVVVDVNRIVSDMRRETSFEGTPAASDPEKAERMVTRLEQVSNTWRTAEFWDESSISLTEGKAPGAPTAVVTHLSVLSDAQLTNYSTDLAGRPDSEVKNLLLVSIETARALKNEAAERQADDGDDPMIGSQVANLDRLFHFYYLLWRTCPKKCPDTEGWQRIYRFLDVVPAQTINQDGLAGILARCAIPELSALRFDDVGGFGGLHKYQHPLMISAKRWANGAAGATRIGAVAQGLNLLDEVHL